MMDREPNSLEELLARLPRDIAPPDHVWAGIARDVAAGRRKLWRPIAAAAALLCICVGGALTWGVLHEHPAAIAPAATALRAATPPAAAGTRSFDEPRRPEYLAARAQLESTFRERLALLQPVTRAKIEADLAVIQRAHEDVRLALAAEPANPLLERFFASTLHDEFDLYAQIVEATQSDSAQSNSTRT
jgi:hypothetical protein